MASRAGLIRNDKGMRTVCTCTTVCTLTRSTFVSFCL